MGTLVAILVAWTGFSVLLVLLVAARLTHMPLPPKQELARLDAVHAAAVIGEPHLAERVVVHQLAEAGGLLVARDGTLTYPEDAPPPPTALSAVLVDVLRTRGGTATFFEAVSDARFRAALADHLVPPARHRLDADFVRLVAIADAVALSVGWAVGTATLTTRDASGGAIFGWTVLAVVTAAGMTITTLNLAPPWLARAIPPWLHEWAENHLAQDDLHTRLADEVPLPTAAPHPSSTTGSGGNSSGACGGGCGL